MIPLPWSARASKTSIQPLINAGFILDVKGHKVVALKLSSKVATEITTNESVETEGLLAKIKTKMSCPPETERWLALTSIENPLLEDHDSLGGLIAEGLTEASGVTVGKSDLLIVGSIRI